MNLGKALVGAVVGAVVGLVVHVGFEYLTLAEAPWLAVATGLLTGVMVRRCDASTLTTASYLRGGLAALIALGGIVGGSQLASQARVVRLRDAEPIVVAPALQTEATDAEASEGETDDPAVLREPTPIAQPRIGPEGPSKRTRPTKEFAIYEFVLIGLGAFLAYEFARGATIVQEADGGQPSGEPTPNTAAAAPPADEPNGASDE